MKEKLTGTQKLLNYLDQFPDFCRHYFMAYQSSNTMNTKLAYANDLKLFFDYLIFNHPHFCYMQPPQISQQDMKLITPTDIDRFIANFIKSEEEDPRRRSHNTAARKRASLSSFFDYLYNSQGIIDKNPVNGAAKIRIPKKDFVIHLKTEEQWKLLDTIRYGTGLSKRQLLYHPKYKKRDFAIFSLALDTGMRVSEIAGISVFDIDMDECSIIIQRKGNKLQKIFFSDAEKSILAEYLEEKQALFPFNGTVEPLFVTLKGERLSIRQMQALFKKYVTVALPGRLDTKESFGFHRLRASFAMQYYMNTEDVLTLQKIMGHTELSATNIYAKGAEEIVKKTRNISAVNFMAAKDKKQGIP